MNDVYNETLSYINTKIEELENRNKKYKDDFILKYDIDRNQKHPKNFEELENNIKNNISEFSECLSKQHEKQKINL